MPNRFLALAVVMVGGAILATAQPRAAAAGKDVTVLGFKLHYLEAGRGAAKAPSLQAAVPLRR